jgi:hypothetical protein
LEVLEEFDAGFVQDCLRSLGLIDDVDGNTH